MIVQPKQPIFVVMNPTSTPSHERRSIHFKTGVDPIGPYSPACYAGGFVFVSGQIGVDPATGALAGILDTVAETRQALANVEAVLAEEHLTLADVVKVTIYCIDLDDYHAVNELYASYFKPGSYPAREMVQVSRLPRNARIEISVVAYKG
jgi:2-iminobutanoate/2-iminopropanoate deaminase